MVTVFVGSNLVLGLVAASAVGDGAEEDFLVAIWSGSEEGEIIVPAVEDTVCLRNVNLLLE